MAALILLTSSCTFLTTLGCTTWCSCALCTVTPYCPLNSVERRDISGVARKNRCRALSLLEIPIIPEWIFIHHSVHLFTSVICSNGYKGCLTLRYRYIPILKFMPGFRMGSLQFVHVSNVPWPKAFVFYPI